MNLELQESFDTRVLIKQHIRKKGITAAHLAREIGVSPQYMYHILSHKRGLSEKNRQKINEALETNF